MSWRMTPLAAAVIVAGGIAATSAGFAEDTPTANPAPQGQGMMGGQHGQGMMNMMTHMMNMMTQMNRMMESPNNNPPAPAKPPTEPSPG